mgnify:CR=1 FL=1
MAKAADIRAKTPDAGRCALALIAPTDIDGNAVLGAALAPALLLVLVPANLPAVLVMV